jgi:hypothetical protein
MTRKQFKQIYYTETYIGDGLYAHFDGYHIVLRAPRLGGDHHVALEPPVFDALLKYRERIYEDATGVQYDPPS